MRTWFFIIAIFIAIFGVAGDCWSAGEALPTATKADRVVVAKKERTLALMSQGRVLKTYKVALGAQPVGPKIRQGDRKTPEGVYLLDRRNPHSQFYRSIHVSYPDAEDRARAKKLGVPPGGDIYVHGLPDGMAGLAAVTA